MWVSEGSAHTASRVHVPFAGKIPELCGVRVGILVTAPGQFAGGPDGASKPWLGLESAIAGFVTSADIPVHSESLGFFPILNPLNKSANFTSRGRGRSCAWGGTIESWCVPRWSGLLGSTKRRQRRSTRRDEHEQRRDGDSGPRWSLGRRCRVLYAFEHRTIRHVDGVRANGSSAPCRSVEDARTG
jgi:hypothetical protein